MSLKRVAVLERKRLFWPVIALTQSSLRSMYQMNLSCRKRDVSSQGFMNVTFHQSLRAAKERVSSQGFMNVTFHQSDIFHMPYDDNSFDHLFLCFVLEHLPNPIEALLCLRRVLKPGGTITVIEGDHGSTYFHPERPGARKTIQCLVDIQAEMGGNSLDRKTALPIIKKLKL